MADKIYTTILGDTWDSIAYRLFEDSKAYDTLLELNPKYNDTVIFSAGIKIKYQDNIAIKSYEETIPPWRR